ncbi:MAG: NAD(P)H-binding protein [Propionibacteriales bacterium]|nr:NAD(P)H-binding protein [Propionibacteriales bacterium]
MKIALYGATGMIGSRITSEALSRGHLVTAISRRASVSGGIDGRDAQSAEASPRQARRRRGDAADADDVARIAAEHDVVVSAIGPSRTGERHQIFLHALSVLAENVGTRRLVVVGGAGSLQVAPGLRLMDTAAFPPSYRPEAVTQGAALEFLKDTGALVDWVYVSPAPAIGPGTRTGAYRVGLEVPIGDWISAEDFAVAIVDEIEVPKYHRTRINVAS